MAMESQTFFSAENRVAPLGIVPLAGARELSEKVEAHLVRWAKRAGMDVDTFIIENSCPRFSSGDSKGLIKSTVRGYDLFFVVDVGNYSLTYNYFGNENHMSVSTAAATASLWTARTCCRSFSRWVFPTF